MEPIIVTICRTGETKELDLLVQPDIPISQLSTYIAEGFSWNDDCQGQKRTYEVECIPPGKILKHQETLADAHVGNGARLVFHTNLNNEIVSIVKPRSNIVSRPAENANPTENPVIGRRQLQNPIKTDEQEIEPHNNTNGYVLRQIDKD